MALATTPGITYSQPLWKTYKNDVCGMKIDYPVYTGALTNENIHDGLYSFKIFTFGSSDNPHSVNVKIDVGCILAESPLSIKLIEPLKFQEMQNPNESIEGFTADVYKPMAVDALKVDGERAVNFETGGLTGIDNKRWVEHIIITNHGGKQYEMYIYLTGKEGEIGFDHIYPPLMNHILESIEFTR
jgi:hypothetical protein